ncbi:hypothetical protein [Lentibacillus sp. CBA3610]|uniref:hypothetical protein n=1 Tax=Lentibacillus sp. CBA3610 TaxID=2518176 RepID=UPI001595C726|nr:hypothetical protein [Lentibacillus sp. CBA3610]QKY71001.1 hypothetical protein Len3610_16770 [Lentibacillus sp. CBA3610]
MYDATFIKQGLYLQGLPVFEDDVPYIQNTLVTINQAQEPLKSFPDLNQTVPITVVDKRLMLWLN